MDDDAATPKERRRAVHHERLELTALSEHGPPVPAAARTPEPAHGAPDARQPGLARHVVPQEPLIEACASNLDDTGVEADGSHVAQKLGIVVGVAVAGPTASSR